MSVSCECCVLSEVSATGWSLVQRSPTDCGVPECDREPSIMRQPWPTMGCCAMGEGVKPNTYPTKQTSTFVLPCLHSLAENGPFRPIHTGQTTGDTRTSYCVPVVIRYTIWVSLYITSAASSNRERYTWHMCQFTVAGSTIWYLLCLTSTALQSAKQMTSPEYKTLFLTCTKSLCPVCLLPCQQMMLLSTKRHRYGLKQGLTYFYLVWESEIFSPSRCRHPFGSQNMFSYSYHKSFKRSVTAHVHLGLHSTKIWHV